MSENKFLASSLKKLEKYFKNSYLNEIIIQDEKEVILCTGSEFNYIKDENIDLNMINTFTRVLANDRGVLFDEKNPSLATSIPNSVYRVQAVHNSRLRNSQPFQLNIRIPPKEIYSIDNFILGNIKEQEEKK